MSYNPDIHQRRSIRLKGYDYATPGAYFVTVCTHERECLFGDIVDGVMRLNEAGRMVNTVWDEIPAHYPGIDVDAFIVMPNHIHGIVAIVGAAPRGRPGPEPSSVTVGAAPRGRPGLEPSSVTVGAAPRGRPGPEPSKNGQPQGVAPTAVGLSLPEVVNRFKTMTTKRYADGVKQNGWPVFPGKLWQRNYYERVIRNVNELSAIREYITRNPQQWSMDTDNPKILP
jgi:REP element-mobilizing transposase RayT